MRLQLLSHSNPKLKILINLLHTNPLHMSLRRGKLGEFVCVCVIDETVSLAPVVRMHIGVSLETCSLVPLTSSWTNACPSVGAPRKEIQRRAAEIEKQMVGEGCIERQGVR